MSKSKRSHRSRLAMKRYGHSTSPGDRPGIIRVPDGALPPQIRVTCYDSEKIKDLEGVTIKEIANFRGKSPVMWIDVVGLGEADIIQQLGDELGLHRLTLGDLVHIPQRSKVEHYENYVFVVTQLPSLSQSENIEQISLIAGKDFILTWRERPSDCFAAVRERLQVAGRPLRSSDADYLLYVLIDAVIDAYYPTLESIGRNIDELDAEMEQGASSGLIGRIHAVRHDVRLLRRIVWPLREAVSMLISDHQWFIGRETSIYLRDCQDHTMQIIDTLENYREACSDLRDYYSSEVSNRMNEVMKVLTVIATIFIPMSFIAGVYGMNFDPASSPWNMPELKWRGGYPLALGLMAAVAIGQLLFFRRRGWLGSSPRKS